GRLPYSVPPSSATGGMMTTLASVLDVYNQGRLTRGCEGFHGDDEEGNHNGEHEDDGCLDDGGREHRDEKGDDDNERGDDPSTPQPRPRMDGFEFGAIL